MKKHEKTLVEKIKTYDAHERFMSFLPVIFVAAILLSVSGIVALTLHLSKDRYSAVYWCAWEIHKHEDYDCEFTYVYQEIEPKEEIKKEADKNCDIYAYYIKAFTDEKVGEWYCFVEFKREKFLDNFLKGYRREQIYLIDCDIIKEYRPGEYL